MFKKSNVLLVLLIFLLGIIVIPCTVAAADSGSVYVSTQGNDSWDGLSATFNNLSGSGPKATIKNATSIVATNGTVYVASGTYRENQINITQSMSIIGANRQNTVINGTKSGFIFNISSGVYVTLANLTLTQGQNDNGGAIVNNGTLTIKDSQFTSNNATTNGGAIYNYGTSTITNSTFFNNAASGQGNSEGIGGAVLNRGVMVIDGSTFSGNIGYRGGALENYAYPNDVYLTVTNSAFINNSANNGGAISSMSTINGGRVYLTLINNSFTNNTATRYGGAIYGNVGNFGVVQFNRFTGNTALTNNANIIYMNGNIDARYNWWGSNSPNLDRTDFDVITDTFSYDPWIVLTITVSPEFVSPGGASNVTADLLHDNHGNPHDIKDGKVSYSGSAGFVADDGHIVDAFFVDGVARTTLNVGGATGLVNVSATVDGETVKEGIYVGIARVDPDDGSFVSRNQKITVTYSEAIMPGSGYDDIKVTDGNGNSKAITKTIDGAKLIISPVGLWDGGVFTLVLPYDAVTNSGGVFIAQSRTSTFIVRADTIYVSKQGNDSWDGLTPSTAKLTIKNAIQYLAENGIIRVASGTYNENDIAINQTLSIVGAGRENTIINGNHSGRIFDIRYGSVTLSNLTLTNGYSNSSGGAIYNMGTLTLNNTAFRDNTATKNGYGGAIYNSGTLNINNSIFTNNTSTRGGGAIYNQGILNIKNSSFTDNTADGGDANSASGGAIQNQGPGTLNVYNTVFTNNTSSLSGGAINNGGTMTITRSTFIGNIAGFGDRYFPARGGAIQNKGSSAIINDSTFINNSAADGGAVYTEKALTVTNTTFTNNTGRFGAIYGLAIDKITVNNSTFTGNNGAIDADNINVDNCTFIGNQGIIDTSGVSTISNSRFFNNTGRLISNRYGGKLTIINSTMSGNTAGDFGLIFNGGKTGIDAPIGEITIINSIITGNTGESRFGIYNFDGIVRVISSIISNNTATSNSSLGSFIYNAYGEVYLSFNQITGNSGGRYEVYSMVSSLYADNNWWGSNNGTDSVYINGKGVNSWLVLTVKFERSVTGISESIAVIVDMLHDNWGNYLDPTNGHVMDGLLVNFMGALGSFLDSTVSLISGTAQTIFTPNNTGSGNVTVDISKLTSEELKSLLDALNSGWEEYLQWVADYNAKENNTNNDNSGGNSQDNDTDSSTNSTRNNSSSSSDGSPSGLSPGTNNGAPTGNSPQEPGDSQTPGETALSVTGESGGSVGESPKSYAVTTNTSGSSGPSQPDTTLVAMIGVVLLLALLGVGFYFKK